MTQHLNGVQRKEGLGWAWGGGVSGKANTNGRQQAAKVELGLLFLVMIHVMGTGLHSCYKYLLNCTKYKQKLSPDVAQ